MACEDYFANEWKSIPTAAKESENISGGFDCNICLDYACDPVVTLCGHLYCWPCLYKWLHSQSTSLSSDQQPKCPVCKADTSHTMVVPLYGRGHSPNEADLEDKAPSLDVAIPPRPPACGTQAQMGGASQCVQQLRYRNPYQYLHYPTQPHGSHMEDSSQPPLFSPSGGTASVGMFGEMVYARVFGNSEGLYAYPNSYHLSGSSSPRLRRQEMQADKSLNRISIFLFCCVLLCLLLF